MKWRSIGQHEAIKVDMSKGTDNDSQAQKDINSRGYGRTFMLVIQRKLDSF